MTQVNACMCERCLLVLRQEIKARGLALFICADNHQALRVFNSGGFEPFVMCQMHLASKAVGAFGPVPFQSEDGAPSCPVCVIRELCKCGIGGEQCAADNVRVAAELAQKKAIEMGLVSGSKGVTTWH